MLRSIKRVVLTSSIAAIVQNGTPTTPDLVIDETWFSNPAYCKESKKWYHLSKTLAEEAAWKFDKENGIDLVAIHPGTVLGPLLLPILHFGAQEILNLINGGETLPSPFRYVDIRDVVYAHIRGFEVPTASGRFEVYKYEPTSKVSQERAKSLGINFIQWVVGVKDIVDSLKEKGFLNI